MKVLNNGTKIRKVGIDCEKQIVHIMYEKSVQITTIMLSFQEAVDMGFINFEALNKVI